MTNRRTISLVDLSPTAQRQAVEQIGAAERRKHKYHAERTKLDGLWFASKRESRRYAELDRLVRARVISHLILQEKFPLIVNNIMVGVYIADFSYTENNVKIVEDVKGVRTPVYKLKKRLMLALHGIEISET